MRILATIVALTFASLGIVRAEDAAPEPTVTWLFMQNAEAMRFDGEILTLVGIAPTVTAFSDRPHRMVAPLDPRGYLALWQTGADSFSADPPNAGLSVLVDGQLRSAVVELAEPTLAGSTMTYKVTVLEGTVPARGDVASLFVDALPTAVNDQITDSVSQADIQVLENAPAVAMGQVYQALDDAAENVATAEQQANTLPDTSTTQDVPLVYSVDVAAPPSQ